MLIMYVMLNVYAKNNMPQGISGVSRGRRISPLVLRDWRERAIGTLWCPYMYIVRKQKKWYSLFWEWFDKLRISNNL